MAVFSATDPRRSEPRAIRYRMICEAGPRQAAPSRRAPQRLMIAKWDFPESSEVVEQLAAEALFHGREYLLLHVGNGAQRIDLHHALRLTLGES